MSVGNGTVFSKLDLAHAYQQVVLEDEAKEMVTINNHKGLYGWLLHEGHPGNNRMKSLAVRE